jgi:VanZ family protein
MIVPLGGLAAGATVDYDSLMTDRLIQCPAWGVLAAIVAVAISPIGLRPDDILSVDLDRALAFMVLTMLFVLSYPRQFLVCASLGILGAGLIEFLQFLSPSRHPHLDDALVKAAGAATGALAGWLINRLRNRLTLA